MKKFLVIIAVALSIITQSSAFAAGDEVNSDPKHSTVLPSTEANCETIMQAVNEHRKDVKDALANRENYNGFTNNDILACGIKTGDIKFFTIPFYIRYILEFIIYIVGFISILGVIYGGYTYLFAGLTEDKDSGKTAIKNSIIGLVLSILAWPIVNIILALLT